MVVQSYYILLYRTFIGCVKDDALGKEKAFVGQPH